MRFEDLPILVGDEDYRQSPRETVFSPDARNHQIGLSVLSNDRDATFEEKRA